MNNHGTAREKWVDDVKVIACILVVLGHFFQSMIKSGILQANGVYEWFETTIYYFHVPLFFICSGYLYQKYSVVNSAERWLNNITKKALTLGVPYATFSMATWMLKTIFSGSVNEQAGGLLSTLLLHPAAPYWYLYTLFFIFIITPTFNDKKMAVAGLSIAIATKILALITGGCSVYAVSTVLSNEIWFVLGMGIVAFDVKIKNNKQLGIGSGLLFMALSIAVYRMDGCNGAVSFAMGLLACTAVILMMGGFEEKLGRRMDFLAGFTMPIFLMHTLFAASMRAVLLKAGIENAIIHVTVGLVSSFAGPMIAAWLMRKTKGLAFFMGDMSCIKQKK